MDVDYYELFGVDPSVSDKELKAAYRRVVKAAHPDKGGSAALFRLLNEAWDVLGDQGSRAHYDAVRRQAKTNPNDPPRPDPDPGPDPDPDPGPDPGPRSGTGRASNPGPGSGPRPGPGPSSGPRPGSTRDGYVVVSQADLDAWLLRIARGDLGQVPTPAPGPSAEEVREWRRWRRRVTSFVAFVVAACVWVRYLGFVSFVDGFVAVDGWVLWFESFCMQNPVFTWIPTWFVWVGVWLFTAVAPSAVRWVAELSVFARRGWAWFFAAAVLVGELWFSSAALWLGLLFGGVIGVVVGERWRRRRFPSSKPSWFVAGPARVARWVGSFRVGRWWLRFWRFCAGVDVVWVWRFGLFGLFMWTVLIVEAMT